MKPIKLRTKTGCIELNKALPSWHSLMRKKCDTGQVNAFSKNSKVGCHAGWREIDGEKYYFRSRWEANYGKYLAFLKQQKQIANWEHEPKTFWFEEIKRGVRSYLPDFQVFENDGTWHWIEVKGYYDSKSLTKIKRFRKYYPEEELRLVDKNWFSKNSKKLSLAVKNWE